MAYVISRGEGHAWRRAAGGLRRVLAVVMALGAAPSHATLVPGLVPPGMYRFDRVDNEGSPPLFSMCLPLPKFEDVFPSYCVIEWDKRQAGVTHFKATCLNAEFITTVRQLDARTWESTDESVIRQATPEQIATYLASRRSSLEKKARQGSVQERAEAEQELAATDAMAALLKDAPPAAPVRPSTAKATFRVTRLGDCKK